MTKPLPTKAKLMIGAVTVASLCALVLGISEPGQSSWPQFLLLLSAAILTSRFKIKLPGLTTTMSGSLPVILLSILHLGLLSSLIIAAAAGISQSFTSNGNQAKPLQVLFNACTLMNSSALGYWAFHTKTVQTSVAAHMLPLVLAAVAYFVANTTPVAGIISLVEGGNALALWHKVFLWSFPNYVIGAGLAAIASAFSSAAGWTASAAVIAVLFAVHQSYKLYVDRSGNSQPKAMATAAGN
jgi:hypothetical protein